MFENAKFRDTYKTNTGLKAYFWFYSTYTKKYYLTLDGAHIGIVVDDEGNNAMVWNEDYEGFEKYFKINVIGKWEEDSNVE